MLDLKHRSQVIVVEKGRYRLLIALLVMYLSTVSGQQTLEWQRWGDFGAGKLVTRISNTNCIGSGRLKFPQLARFPAFEYPYNADKAGIHYNYAVGVSFHVGGFSSDRGPACDYDKYGSDTPLVETGDQAEYKYYKCFHFDGFPDYLPLSSADDDAILVPRSDVPSSWPMGGWPATYPITDPVLQRIAPDYPTIYSENIANPIPLLLDRTLGFPGSGPNRHSPEDIIYPGKVIADQETFAVSFAKSRDALGNSDIEKGHLMIYTTLRGLSWKGDLAEDFLYWIFTVTNIGTAPIDSTYFGMFADFDFPWASYTEYRSYSDCDAFAFDTYDVDDGTQEEHKIAYGWDGDGYVFGATMGDWVQRQARLVDEYEVDRVALAGVIFLQTPIDSVTGEELGISSWDAFGVANADNKAGIGNYAEKFYWLNIFNSGASASGTGRDQDDLDGDRIDDWTWENPFPMGMESVYDYGDRAGMTINTGPFRLEPGETDTLICATIMGESRADLFKNARTAREIYLSGWLLPKSPFEPRVVAEAGNGKITLRWSRLSERDSLSALVNRQPFEGYRILRSEDGGFTWGDLPITDENGTAVDYIPLAQYDLDNDITGASVLKPWFNRGGDTGLEGLLADEADTANSIRELYLQDLDRTISDTLCYVFEDSSVYNGFTYQYAVLAYGAGGEPPDGVEPLQNARTSGPNVVTLVPHAPQATNESDLTEVKVVPNPYRVVNPQETATRERMVKFTHLPTDCSIRIFNVAGELIVTLQHDAGSPIPSEEQWNLRSSENREVAPGLYFYFLESDIGSATGKFAIIK
jgi:hypothetical protein